MTTTEPALDPLPTGTPTGDPTDCPGIAGRVPLLHGPAVVEGDSPITARLRALASMITYRPGYRLHVGQLDAWTDLNGAMAWFELACDRPDAVTGEHGTGYGGRRLLPYSIDDTAILQTILGALIDYEVHEVREFFHFRQEAIFGPHGHHEALHEAARQARLWREADADAARENG